MIANLNDRPSVGKEGERLFYQGNCERCKQPLYAYEDVPRRTCGGTCYGEIKKRRKAAA